MFFKENYSNCSEISKLVRLAMKDDFIREITSIKKYSTKVLSKKGNERTVHWRNTNQLLSQGFEGMKTGTTYLAGYCLAAVK